jgi:hypothetical protein
MARSYNSVGAGETPKLGGSDCCDVAGPGGSGQHTRGVKIVTDLPSVARPGAQQGGMRGGGEAPKVARPGGAQGAHKSGTVNSSKYESPD